MLQLHIDNPAVFGLTCVVVAIIGIFSVRRFHTLVCAGHSYPKDAQSWTTPFNFILSTLLYVSLAIVIFAILDNLPDLVVSIVNAFSAGASEEFKAWVKDLATQDHRSFGMPILAAAALALLFAFKYSPFGFVDNWVRETLQGVASIPTKVRVTLAEIGKADFNLPPARRQHVLTHLSTVLGRPFDPNLLAGIDPELETLILKSASLDLAFHEWKSALARFSDLYRDNQQEMEVLEGRFSSLFGKAELHLALLKQVHGAGAELAIAARTSELKRDFSALLQEQLIPLTCAIVQSSSNPRDRTEYLESFGYKMKERPDPQQVYQLMREDFDALVFFLILIAYPVITIFARACGWRPDNGYLDLLVVWPVQLACFAIAAALPPILRQKPPRTAPAAERPATAHGGVDPARPRRFLGYLLVGLAGGVFGVLAIVVVGTVGGMLTSLSFSDGVEIIRELFVKSAPFGLVAATVGIVTAILMDVPYRFRMRFVVDGLVTGAIAAVFAFVAVLAQSKAAIGGLWGVITLDPDELSRNPGLSVLRFVVPMVFAMGFCIGLIVPRGFRRYSDGHMMKDGSSSDARLPSRLSVKPVS